MAPFPPKPPISPQTLAYLERKGVPAVAAALAKLPVPDLIPSEQPPAFEIGHLDGKMVCVTQAEAEQWLRWRGQTDAAWVKVTAVTSIIAAVAAVVAAIRG